MKRILGLCLVACVLLGGCASLTDDYYVSTTPHKPQDTQTEIGTINASDYDGLCTALANMAQAGTEGGIIYVSRYDQSTIAAHMQRAVDQTLKENPVAAYAVDRIDWELGTSSGQSAVAVNISYLHDASEIRNIRRVSDLAGAREVIAGELDEFSTGVVLYLENYQQTDFAQIVEDYADEYPQAVMETPQVTANIYPDEGKSRVVELKFSYTNSRDALRNMQQMVSRIFASAVLYVSGDAADTEKFSLMYSFLMERYEYTFETSITPTYSLLRHGVGDARAFAVVYAAMCRDAGLDCRVITGTREGEPWYWNMINDGGKYCHVDLLRSSELGEFQEWDASRMDGYVWDYSAYPSNTEEQTDPPQG